MPTSIEFILFTQFFIKLLVVIICYKFTLYICCVNGDNKLIYHIFIFENFIVSPSKNSNDKSLRILSNIFYMLTNFLVD